MFWESRRENAEKKRYSEQKNLIYGMICIVAKVFVVKFVIISL